MKQFLRNWFPRKTAYLAHLKALYQNEVELRLLPWLCDPREISIDVGAFSGTYSTGLSIYARRVLAVEPQPLQAAALRKSMPGNVEIVEAALSDVAGCSIMKLSSPGGGSMSTLNPQTAGWDWIEIPVRLMRLDDLRKERIGFVKIDAEGHETQVLRGADHILKHDKPNLLIEAEERNDAGSVGRIIALLAGYGYVAYFVRGEQLLPISEFRLEEDQDPRRLTGGQRRAYSRYINNFIFLHPERKVRILEYVPTPWRACVGTITMSMRGRSA
jgi:FkbM family methyltransferase